MRGAGLVVRLTVLGGDGFIAGLVLRGTSLVIQVTILGLTHLQVG